jgi:hypothetical protein
VHGKVKARAGPAFRRSCSGPGTGLNSDVKNSARSTAPTAQPPSHQRGPVRCMTVLKMVAARNAARHQGPPPTTSHAAAGRLSRHGPVPARDSSGQQCRARVGARARAAGATVVDGQRSLYLERRGGWGAAVAEPSVSSRQHRRGRGRRGRPRQSRARPSIGRGDCTPRELA